MVEQKNNWWEQGVAMFTRLSAWIAVPVVIGIFVGKWLDKKYNTEPWLFLATVGLMFLVSMFGLIKEATIEFKKISSKQQTTNNKQQGVEVKFENKDKV